MSDKIAALALIIQDSPIHNLRSLDSLIAFCMKKEQRSCQMAMEAIKDVLIHNILPDRKLTSFSSHDWYSTTMTMSKALKYWYEDQLIGRISQFIDLIEDIGLKSNIEYFKKICLDIICDLLIHKPEQEARLLSLLINKLGDPSRIIHNKVIECINKIISIHNCMLYIIIREIRQFISRPNISPRCVYLSINYLITIKLHKTHTPTHTTTTHTTHTNTKDNNNNNNNVILQLIECYISLFEIALKNNIYGSKLLSSLLHGISICYPYIHKDERSSVLAQYIDPLFKITHNEHFLTAVQALTLISHIALDDLSSSSTTTKSTATTNQSTTSATTTTAPASVGTNEVINRFYRALYAILFTDQVMTRSRNTLFFKLLYRSLRLDNSDLRLVALYICIFMHWYIYICLCIMYNTYICVYLDACIHILLP